MLDLRDSKRDKGKERGLRYRKKGKRNEKEGENSWKIL
jgi:hypothetical protein